MSKYLPRLLATLLTIISILALVNAQCGKGFEILDKVDTAFEQALAPGLSCKWDLIGSRICEVEVTCTIDLPAEENCPDNYLIVTDGFSGIKRSCGSETFTVKPSTGLRDIFLELVTSDEYTGEHKGIECTAKCASNDETPRLAEGLERHVNERCVCGLRNEDDRIVGGVDARFNEFPWLAAIVLKGTRQPFCGGALINDRFILTAAHCFYFAKKPPGEIDVLLHAHTLDMLMLAGAQNVELGQAGSIRGPGWEAAKKTDEDEATIRLEAEEIIYHPLFNVKYNYDYALIRLKKKVDLGDSDITPVCLPPANTFDEFGLDGKNFTVAGWGFADEKAKGSTRLLQKLDMPYIDWPTCKTFYVKHLTERMICAGFLDGIKDACTGDSGGPLVHQLENKQFWQMGVVSWGDGCARAKKPGVYAQVTEMAQWINFHAYSHDAKWCKDSK
ncbi:unnamed protein product [Orchesella dallaii]|uniref:Uncharacterized protein n=1 Tax=Orchesella dallaii TaxID=48710 RepID=A0ABP1RJ98_9HEXA